MPAKFCGWCSTVKHQISPKNHWTWNCPDPNNKFSEHYTQPVDACPVHGCMLGLVRDYKKYPWADAMSPPATLALRRVCKECNA